MLRPFAFILFAALFPGAAFADGNQPVLDACIASWGKASPFKKGKAADTVLAASTTVFGIGGGTKGNDSPTEKPVLVLVRPAVNVAGKSTITLNNPNGWYCLRSTVNVAGALHINAHCKAHLASARDDGTTVGAADETGKGVTVFGAIRVNRIGCDAPKPK